MKKKIYMVLAVIMATTMLSGCRKNETTIFNMFGTDSTVKTEETENPVEDIETTISTTETELPEIETTEIPQTPNIETEATSTGMEPEVSIEPTEEVSVPASTMEEDQEVPTIMKTEIYDVYDTVKVIEDADGYITTDETSSSAVIIPAGTICRRTAISSNGFSFVEASNGIYYYIRTDKTEIEKPIDQNSLAFTDRVDIEEVNDIITITVDNATLYSDFTYDSDQLATIPYGTSCQRTGICSNGWSRVSTNVGDLYVAPDTYSE